MNTTEEQQQLELRQEIAARHLVVHLLRNAISNFRLLCHRRVITVGRDVEFHWPKSWSAPGTRQVYREKVAGFNNKEEVIELVKFLAAEPNPLLEAFGIHLHGRDLLCHLSSTSHWHRNDIAQAEGWNLPMYRDENPVLQ